MADEDPTRDAVVIERTLDAPVHDVWRMWTEPEHFAAWYGPAGATVPVARMDVRVGGSRLVCMEMSTPDGSMQMWFAGEYREVTVDRRLVYTEFVADSAGEAVDTSEMGMPDSRPAVTEVVVDLEDLGGRTRMVMTHLGVPSDSPAASGWSMAFDALADHLRADATSG